MLTKAEHKTLRSVVTRVEVWMVRETEIIRKSKGRVADAALLRRDEFQDVIRELRPLLTPEGPG